MGNLNPFVFAASQPYWSTREIDPTEILMERCFDFFGRSRIAFSVLNLGLPEKCSSSAGVFLSAAFFLFFRRQLKAPRQTSQIWALRLRLEKQLTDLRRRHYYMRDGAL